MARKTVLVTGASRGIGKAIAIKFAKKGYNIAISCINRKTALMQTKKDIESYQVDCYAFVGDVGNYSECQLMFSNIKKHLGNIDILINNAGISYIGLLQDMTPEDWNTIISTNLTSIFNCSKLAIPSMIEAKRGKIINISSVWGNFGASMEVAYSATKGGVNSFTKALAKELAPSKIQVNAIACGAIDTEMNSFMSDDELLDLIDEIPMNRLGRAEEIANFAYHLAYKDSYLTGQIISIDGAWC
jgi:Dehydrogenases with different specificities (related to short-chain alcohol dehydrogenases)